MMWLLREIIPYPACEDQLNDPGLFDAYNRSVSELESNGNVADDDVLEFSQHLFETGSAHRATVEGRATVCIGATSISATLTVALVAALFRGEIPQPHAIPAFIVVIFLLITLVYFVAAAIFALGVHGSRKFRVHILGPLELIPSSDLKYRRQVGLQFLKLAIENYKVNSRQSDLLHRSQTSLRNGMLALLSAGMIAILAQDSFGKPSPTLCPCTSTPTAMATITAVPSQTPIASTPLPSSTI